MKRILSCFSLSHLKYRNILPVLFIGAMLISTFFGFVSHAEATSQHVTTHVIQHCQTVLAKLHSGEKVSRVLSHQCVQGNQRLAAPRDTVLLIDAFSNAGYSGLEQTYWGYDGPCDASGYGIPDVGFVLRNQISSWVTGYSCPHVRGYSGTSYSGDCAAWYDKVSYVGNYWNDRINSFKVASIYNGC